MMNRMRFGEFEFDAKDDELSRDPTHPRYIETVRHRGYRLLAPIVAIESPAAAAAGRSGVEVDRPTKPMQPGEESLSRPAFAIAAQLAAVLRLTTSKTAFRKSIS